jgi:hypothetical protein
LGNLGGSGRRDRRWRLRGRPHGHSDKNAYPGDDCTRGKVHWLAQMIRAIQSISPTGKTRFL